MELKFKVGDVCITQNSRVPLLNDNVIVVIIDIEPGKTSRDGESTPYLIRRIDGQMHPSTVNATTGRGNWYKHPLAFCAERKLRKAVPDELPEGTFTQEQLADFQKARDRFKQQVAGMVEALNAKTQTAEAATNNPIKETA